MVATGSLLPVMDVLFGKFVNVFNDFARGEMSPGTYRKELSKYTYANLPECIVTSPHRQKMENI